MIGYLNLKHNREKNLFTSVFILLFGTVIPKFTSIITLPIITSVLTKTSLGSYDLILTSGAMLLPIVTMQIHAGAFRFLIDADREESKKSIITNTVIFSLIFLIATLLLSLIVLVQLSLDSLMMICIFMYLSSDVIINVVKQFARGLSNTKIYSQSTVLNSIFELVTIFILFKIDNLNLFTAVLALVLGQLLASLYIVIKLKLITFLNYKFISLKVIKDLLNYSWPLVPSSFSSWVISASDKFLIAAFLDIEAVAINAIAVKLPNLFSYAQNAFNLAWQENASSSILDTDSSDYYSKIFNEIHSILVSLMSIIIALTPVIFFVLIKGDYDDAYSLMSIRFIAALFSSMSAYLGGIYIALKKSKNMGITTMITAIVSFLFNFILISHIGLHATAISCLISYILLFVYRAINIQNHIKITFNYSKIISLTFILILMAYFCSLRNYYTNLINIFISLVLVTTLMKSKLYYLKNKFIR